MTAGEFIAKWRSSELKERSAAQEHFIDLCRLLGDSTPAGATESALVRIGHAVAAPAEAR